MPITQAPAFVCINLGHGDVAIKLEAQHLEKADHVDEVSFVHVFDVMPDPSNITEKTKPGDQIPAIKKPNGASIGIFSTDPVSLDVLINALYQLQEKLVAQQKDQPPEDFNHTARPEGKP